MQILPLYQITFPWLKDIWSLFFGTFFEIFRCLILISGYLVLISGFVLCTNPSTLQYYLALVSGYILYTNLPSLLFYLALISVYLILISVSLILISGYILCANPPSLPDYVGLILGYIFSQILPLTYNMVPYYQGVWSWFQGLHKFSQLTILPCPDFRVSDFNFRILEHIHLFDFSLILISGYIICTNPPSLLY